MVEKVQRYSKPGQVGGTLIREVIRFMKLQGESLPLNSHILIAVSGGSDSVALAHLLVHFGRRIINRDQILLLYIQHSWRGAESEEDEKWVQSLGKSWNVPVVTHRVKPPQEYACGESWEDQARLERKKIFELECRKRNAVIFTAHHADDSAETLIWRLMTGSAQTHGGGILFRYGSEVRPLLRVRKSTLRKYLEEVGVCYREDPSNQSGQFLRSRLRSEVMPQLERLFPKAVPHLAALALSAQESLKDAKNNRSMGKTTQFPFYFLKATGLKLRRPHLQSMMEKLVAKKLWYGEIHLPGGWRLIRHQLPMQAQAKNPRCLDRWTFEQY